jgi:hypothetical protein
MTNDVGEDSVYHTSDVKEVDKSHDLFVESVEATQSHLLPEQEPNCFERWC